MSRKQASTKAHISRTAKIRALAKRAGTPGEQVAAEAALERLGESLVRPTGTGIHLTDAIVRGLQPPAKGNKITYDGTPGAPAGFGVRITAAGTSELRHQLPRQRHRSGTQAHHRRIRVLVNIGGKSQSQAVADGHRRRRRSAWRG